MEIQDQTEVSDMKKKALGRILIAVAAVGGLIFLGLVLAPFLFRDKIVAFVEKTVNEQVDATVTFEQVDISLLRSFPSVSLGLRGLSVIGKDRFEGLPLLQADYLGVAVDFWSAWNFGEVPLKILSLEASAPIVRVRILPDGTANYDIAKSTPDTAATKPSDPYHIELRDYRITDAQVEYDDRAADLYCRLAGLSHRGTGDFTQADFRLQTETTVGQLSFASGGQTYLDRATLKYIAGFQVNLPESRYTFLENTLTINGLALQMDGWVQIPEAPVPTTMDLRISSPATDFKSLLSMIPNAYTADFDRVAARGTYAFAATAKGQFDEATERFPSISLQLQVRDGSFQYPELPMGVGEIQVDLSADVPENDLDGLVLDIRRFGFRLDGNPIAGDFRLTRPLTDPDIRSSLQGTLDLGDLVQAFPMEGVETLAGILALDIRVAARQSAIDQDRFDQVDMTGSVRLNDLTYRAADMPALRIPTATATLQPGRLLVDGFECQLGRSDVRGSGSIDNPLAYFSPDATLRGTFRLQSELLDLDEWSGETPPEEPQDTDPAPATASSFDRYRFELDYDAQSVVYHPYKLDDFRFKGILTPQTFSMENLQAKVGDSDFRCSGTFRQYMAYAEGTGRLTGNLELYAGLMDLNMFLSEDTSTTEDSGPILLPGDMDLVIRGRMDRVLYDNMELQQAKGTLHLADEKLSFQEVEAQTLGGKIAFTGSYDTRTPESPLFDMGLSLKDMDFQQAFRTFQTFRAIAPIGQFIHGKFNTTLTMRSNLGLDLMPVLPSLDASGMLQTLDATIRNFAPLVKVGEMLNIAAFRELNLKNSKNWFKVEDGMVTLSPFTYRLEDIEMNIGGRHALTGGMDYQIDAKIPRDKLKAVPGGQALGAGWDLVRQEASKLGVNLQQGNFVNVRILVSGDIKDPKVGLKFLGLDGEGEPGSGTAAAVAGAIQEAVEKKMDELKTEAEATVRQELQEVKQAAMDTKDSMAQDLKQKAATEGSKVLEKAAGDAKAKAAEEARKQLEKINPFKKKKEGGGGGA